jgi:hypothetical protein
MVDVVDTIEPNRFEVELEKYHVPVTTMRIKTMTAMPTVLFIY